MGLFNWFNRKSKASATKAEESCVHCGKVGHFGRRDSDGPVCDECARKIMMDVLTGIVSESTSKSENDNRSETADPTEILTCDSCGNNIPRNKGYALSTPQVIMSPRFWEFQISERKLADNENKIAMLATMHEAQTTPWFICEKCSQYFSFSHEIARAEACKTNPQPPGRNSVDHGDSIWIAGLSYMKIFGQWPSTLLFGDKTPNEKEIEKTRSVVYSEKWPEYVAEMYNIK